MLYLDKMLDFVKSEELNKMLTRFSNEILSIRTQNDIDNNLYELNTISKCVIANTAAEIVFEDTLEKLQELNILPYKNQDELHKKLQAAQLSPELIPLIKLMKTPKSIIKNSDKIQDIFNHLTKWESGNYKN